MRIAFWVTAFAVLSIAFAKNSTAKTKPKRQLESIRTPQNLQYSLVLPHSRVAHFRSLTSSRRISNVAPRGGKLPPYAVQMEPVVQYSQKDPLYGSNHEHVEETVVNKNEIYAQPKILNVHDGPESSFGPPYGSLPTAPLYSQEAHPQYYDAPEPIIEIIIKESNETLPAPPPPPVQKKKKEPVQVFYVKYSKDPHSKDKVVYEKPIPAITPPSNDEDDHHEDYVTVTPEPLYIPVQTTTLRAIIKPESEIYHTDSNVKVTFGNDHHHYGNRRAESPQGEQREETAPRPAIALPNYNLNEPPQSERSASPRPQYNDHDIKLSQHNPAIFQQEKHAQSRIQFQQPFLSHEPQLPRPGPSVIPFRAQPHQNNFGPSPSLSPRPSFYNVSPSPSNHFANIAPTLPGPIGPSFATFSRPNGPPQSFNSRPSNSQHFGTRQHFPPRASFHSGPQRPFHQPQNYFDEAKYLQENYHTITTDQVDPPKVQLLPNKQIQNFNTGPKPGTIPTSAHFADHQGRPQQIIPFNQQLPQQRPPQQFLDSNKNKLSISNPSSRSPFFNLKPSPPHIEENRTPFQRQPSQQHINFHQGQRPSVQINTQEHSQSQNSFSGLVSPSPSPSPSSIPHSQFLPHPSSSPLLNFHPQSPSLPNQVNFQQHPGPSERPQGQINFQPVSNSEHQDINQFVPNGGELVPAISKYEQHIVLNGPTGQPNLNGFNSLSQSTPAGSQHQQSQQHHHQKQQQEHQQQHQPQYQQQHQPQHQQQPQQQHQQQQHLQQQQQQSQYFDAEQEQVRQQLAQNVRKQQEEIQRLQFQLQYAQNQHQQKQEQQQKTQFEQNFNQYQQQTLQSSPTPQYVQERSRPHSNYVTSTATPYYQSTSRTVEIKPSTQTYVSSTANIISSTPEPKKEEKKRPAIELPDEVPDDLRQQLLSSGILDNADISVLDYDKVGETPLESLPPDQLANFFSAGGGQQIAASEHRPIVVKPNGGSIESRVDDNVDEDDQDIAASENLPSYIAPPPKQGVEMKVVHFDPKTAEGQKIANNYVKEDATQVDPVALNDKKYNRYLPLKVSGNQFPLPDILKGKKITSVVVLAPVQTEALNGEHSRAERATDNLKGIQFVAGDSLHNLLKKPTKDNFEKWLDVEKKTASDEQSVILLVTGNDEPAEDREIFMYDIASGKVNKLDGELSNAFVEAAENNSLSKDFEKLAIAGDGTPEHFNKESKDAVGEGSENVPLFVDLSGVRLDNDSSGVLISSGYSKTKRGRAIRKH